MASCEKCWRDSMGDPDRYGRLVRERNCTPEQQAGLDADDCPKCGRRARHQFTGECMACGYDPRRLVVESPDAAKRAAQEGGA